MLKKKPSDWLAVTQRWPGRSLPKIAQTKCSLGQSACPL